MIALNSATRSLTCVLAGAKNTNDCPFVASYEDVPNSPAVGGAGNVGASNPGNTNGVTAVTLMAAPPGYPNYTRKLKSLNINNADLAAVTISITYVDSAGSSYVLAKFVLQTLEQLTYEDGFGFKVLTSDGAEKSQAAGTSSATSTAQATASAASVSVSAASVSISALAVSAATNSSTGSLNTLGSSQASSIAATYTTTSSVASRTKSSFGW